MCTRVTLFVGILASLFFGIYFPVNAQLQVFQRTFGGSGDEFPTHAINSTDGNIFVLASTKSYGSGDEDALLIKMTTNGVVLWSKAYGFAGRDRGMSLMELDNGDILMVVETKSVGQGGWEIMLIKTNELGDEIWAKTIGTADHDWGRTIRKSLDGNYLIGGYTQYFNAGSGTTTFSIQKVDINGNLIWAKSYGTNTHSSMAGFEVMPDSTMVITGGGTTGPDTHASLVKVAHNGDMLWARTYNVGSQLDVSHALEVVFDSSSNEYSYVVCGFTESFGEGGRDAFLFKTNSTGEIEWAKTYGGIGTDQVTRIKKDVDGGFILSGLTDTYGFGETDFLNIKTDSAGVVQWTHVYGGLSEDRGGGVNYLELINDDEYRFFGRTQSLGGGGDDIYMISTNNLGQSFCSDTVINLITNNVSFTELAPSYSTVNLPLLGDSITNLSTTVVNLFTTTSCDSTLEDICSHVAIDSALVASYSFSGAAADESGNGNDGEERNGVSLTGDRFGNVNSAYEFDGVDDYIEVEDGNNSLDVGNTFTISAWFNTSDFTKVDAGTGLSRQAFLSYGFDDLDGKNNLFYIEDGILGFDVRGNNSSYSDLRGTTVINNNTWYHAVMTYDGDSAKIFLNGNLEDVKKTEMNMTANSRLQIGRYQNPAILNINYLFEGKIDDINIYDRILAFDEIIELLNGNTISIEQSICQGDSILVGGSYQTQAGVYYDTLQTVNGCDSVIKTNLTLSPTYYLPYPDSDIVASYSFSGAAADESGNGNDGEERNGVSLTGDRFGNVNSAYEFDGVDDYIEVEDGNNSLDVGNTFTISAWFNTSDFTKVDAGTGLSRQAFLSYGFDDLDGKNNLFYIEDGILGFDVRGNNSSYSDLRGTTVINNNTWYHAVMTYDGDSAKIFLNGNLEDVKKTEMNMTANSRLQIGRYQNPAILNINYLFEGKIDDINIYDRILAFDEIIELLNGNTISIEQSICQGDSILVGGSYQTQAGVYYDTLQTVNGCDSVLSMKLKVNPSYNFIDSLTINSGDSTLVFGDYKKETGIYYDSSHTINGCDSISIVKLMVDPTHGAPVNLRTIFIQDTSAVLRWETLADAISYKIVMKEKGTPNWTQTYFRYTNKGILKVDDLTPSTDYTWSIMANLPSTGWTKLAYEVHFKTLDNPCINPSDLFVSGRSHDRAKFNWTIEANVLEYKIAYREEGTTKWSIEYVDGSRNKKWVLGLKASTIYEWRIKSICAPKTSGNKWSSIMTFKTFTSPQNNSIGSKQVNYELSDSEFLEWSIYPNPTTGIFTVDIVDNSKAINRVIQVIDISGKVVYETTLTDNSPLQIDLSELQSGLYMINTQNQFKKLILSE